MNTSMAQNKYASGQREHESGNIFVACESLACRDTIVPEQLDGVPEYAYSYRLGIEFSVTKNDDGASRSALDFMRQAQRNGFQVHIFTMRDEAMFRAADCHDESPAAYSEWMTIGMHCTLAALQM